MLSTAAFTICSVLHFVETGRINPKTAADLMPESAYALALDHLVLACVDLVFFYQNQILLARRNHFPRKTWWVMGGRMVAGESPVATAQRKAFEEAGLEHLAGDRCRFIGVYSTSFAFREQAPIQHGSHTINLTYLIKLTEPEKNALKLTHDEYEADYQWVQLDQVIHLIDPNDSLDQALLAIVHDVKARTCES